MLPPNPIILPPPATTFQPEKHVPFENVIVVLASVSSCTPDLFYLTAEETVRAAKFAREEDRIAFQYRHHLLRFWLSIWLKQDPLAIRIQHNPFGKPVLPDQSVCFNISRSGNQLAFIFACAEVGIDIEMSSPAQHFSGIAKRYFHPAEQEQNRNDDSFFRIWTRKEAVLKAQGTGLIDGLERIDCTKELVVLGGHSYQLKTLSNRNAIISIAYEERRPPLKVLTFNA